LPSFHASTLIVKMRFSTLAILASLALVNAVPHPQVSQIGDGQPQAPTNVVSQISDGQVQATPAPAVSEKSEGQPVVTSQAVSQISDGLSPLPAISP
jgi:hypothetical protein